MSDNQPSPNQSARIGIDLGGTKIEGVLLAYDGRELARHRIAAPRSDYRMSLSAIRELVTALQYHSGIRKASIGIGIPGSIAPATSLVQNANSVWLNEMPLQRDLEHVLGQPVRLANDANCFAISEATDGAGSGARSLFGVILGTGCGGGIVIRGEAVNGPLSVGGEWGHNPMPWATAAEHPGPRCWCGRLGCMETWVSGTGLAEDHTRVTGEACSGETIAARASAGDTAARATLARHASRLARGLAHVVNLIDPEVIVLGGGLSKLAHLYADVPILMAPYVFSDHALVKLVPPRWGDASGVRGAAWLWPA